MKTSFLWTNTFILPCFGFISGIISFYLKDSFLYIPGAVFGICIGLYYLLFRKIQLMQLVLFIFFSTGAYFSAHWSALLFTMLVPNFRLATNQFTMVPSFFIAGFVGSTVLYFSSIFTLDTPSVKRSRILFSLYGGLLGISWLFLPQGNFTFSNDTGLPHSFMYLFVTWQTGMAFLIGKYFIGNNQGKIKIVRKPHSVK